MVGGNDLEVGGGAGGVLAGGGDGLTELVNDREGVTRGR